MYRTAAVLVAVCSLIEAKERGFAQASVMTGQHGQKLAGPAAPGPVPDA